MRTGIFFMLATCLSLSAQSYVSSWIGNSLGGKDNEFIAHDAKDACVMPDGKVVCGTWWEEGHREVCVYWKDGSKDLPDRGKALAVAQGKGLIAFNSWTGTPQSHIVNVYRFPSNALVKTISIDTCTPDRNDGILGLAFRGDTLYVSDRINNRIRRYIAKDSLYLGSFAVTKPRKLAVDKSGWVWVIVDGVGANTLTPGTGAVVQGYDPAGTLRATITNVLEPTDIAVDNQGRLLIADSGPGREHIRIYSVGAAPALVTTFGESFFGGANPGKHAPDRFAHIVGVDTDSLGNMYVVWNGLPTSDAEGLFIRALRPDGTLLWEKTGAAFIDNAAPDPDTLTKVYTKSEIFEVDYTAAPGADWKMIGYTLDRHRFPYDPRAYMKHSFSYQVVRLDGKLFMLTTDMWSNYFTMFRFEGNVAIPAMMVAHNTRDGAYPPNRTAGKMCIWVDGSNGGTVDGQFGSVEFAATPMDTMSWSSYRVDEKNFLASTRGWRFPFLGVSAAGIPQFDFHNGRSIGTIPSTDLPTVQWRRYDAENDVMYAAGLTPEYPDIHNFPSEVGRVLVRYDSWSTAPVKRYAALLYYDPNTSKTEFDYIRQMEVAGDYIFAAHGGLWGGKGSKIFVYDARTGAPVDTMVPGPEIGVTGLQDISLCIHAFYEPKTGQYIVFQEEDNQAKVLMYKWCPRGTCGSVTDALTSAVPVARNPLVRIRANAGRLTCTARDQIEQLSLIDSHGRIIFSANGGPSQTISIEKRLVAGVYHLSIETPLGVEKQRVVIR